MHGNVWRCCTLGISGVCPFAICCTWHNSCGFRIETDLFFRLLMSPYFLPIQLYLSNVITVSSLNKTFIYGDNITQSGSVTPWRYQEYLKVYQKVPLPKTSFVRTVQVTTAVRAYHVTGREPVHCIFAPRAYNICGIVLVIIHPPVVATFAIL